MSKTVTDIRCYDDRSAAIALGVSKRHVTELRRAGHLPYSKLGRRTVIQHRDLVALLERNRVSAGSADAA